MNPNQRFVGIWSACDCSREMRRQTCLFPPHWPHQPASAHTARNTSPALGYSSGQCRTVQPPPPPCFMLHFCQSGESRWVRLLVQTILFGMWAHGHLYVWYSFMGGSYQSHVAKVENEQ